MGVSKSGFTPCAVFILLPFYVVFSSNTRTIEIYHLSNILSYGDGICENGNKCYGGVGRVGEYIKKARQKAKASGTTMYFFIVGDTASQSPDYAVNRVKIVSEIVNYLEPDAMVVGRATLRNLTFLEEYCNSINSPILATNVIAPRDNKKLLKEIKLGDFTIVGAITGSFYPSEMVLPVVTELCETTNAIYKKGEKFIITLSSADNFDDISIAQNCPHVNIVVGGWEMAMLYNGKQPSSEKVEGTYPNVVTKTNNKEAVVLETYGYTKYLGHLTVEIDDHGYLVNYDGNPILIEHSMPSDPVWEEKYAPLKNNTERTLRQTLTETRVVLNNKYCLYRECALGNMVADAYAMCYAETHNGMYWTDISVVVITAKSLLLSIPRGPITFNQSLWMAARADGLICTKIVDDQLKKLLEIAFDDSDEFKNEFFQVSGLIVVADMSRPKGNRVVSIKYRCARCSTPMYTELYAGKEISLIINYFMITDKLFAKFFSVKTWFRYDCLTYYLRKVKILYPSEGDRIIILNRAGIICYAKVLFLLQCVIILSKLAN